MAISPDVVSLTGFEPVNCTGIFDVQFYRDNGVNFDDLENPNPAAAMPSLRQAANLMVRTGEDLDPTPLDEAYFRVFDLIHAVGDAVNLRNIGLDHPAVISWQERNAKSDHPDPRRISNLLIMTRYVGIDLVSSNTSTGEGGEEQFQPIVTDNGNLYYYPRAIANQLASARVGVCWQLAIK